MAYIPARSYPDSHHTQFSKPASRHDHYNWGVLNVEMRYGGMHSWRDLDTNWVKHTHIDGGSYYYHSNLRIITGDDMDNDKKWRNVIDIRNEFMDVLVTDGILRHLPQDVVSIITLDDFDMDQSTVVLLSYEAQSVIKCAEGSPVSSARYRRQGYQFTIYPQTSNMKRRHQITGIALNPTQCM